MRDDGPAEEFWDEELTPDEDLAPDALAEELDLLRFEVGGDEIAFGKSPAILVLGCQRGLLDPDSPWPQSSGAAAIDLDLRPVRRLLAGARRVAVPVLFTVCAPVSSEEGTAEDEWAAIDPRLTAELDEPWVRTGREGGLEGSAFEGGELAGHLTELEIDTLILVGAAANESVLATASEAKERGLCTLVPRECVGDRSQEKLRAGLLEIQRSHGDVVEIGEALAYLERAHIEAMLSVLE